VTSSKAASRSAARLYGSQASAGVVHCSWTASAVVFLARVENRLFPNVFTLTPLGDDGGGLRAGFAHFFQGPDGRKAGMVLGSRTYESLIRHAHSFSLTP
jgi:hypothetical protein